MIGASFAFFVSVMPITPLAGQTRTACSGPDCQLTLEEALAAVAQVNQRKQDFVGAVRQLTRGAGRNVRRRRDARPADGPVHGRGARRVGSGDCRVRGSRPAGHPSSRSPHRPGGRLSRPLPVGRRAARVSQAGLLDPRRADAHTFQALVYTISNQPAAAAAALAKASAIEAGKPAVVYSMARQLALAGQDDEAAAALRAFVAAQQTRLVDRSIADVGRAPFERVALLRQVPGVAPIFPPALYADAFTLLTQGAYTAAVALFQQAIERDPLNSDALDRERLAQGSAALRAGRCTVGHRALAGRRGVGAGSRRGAPTSCGRVARGRPARQQHRSSSGRRYD